MTSLAVFFDTIHEYDGRTNGQTPDDGGRGPRNSWFCRTTELTKPDFENSIQLKYIRIFRKTESGMTVILEVRLKTFNRYKAAT